MQPDTLFVVSSDFCHWGYDFDYSPYENFNDEDQGDCTPIWEFIQALDMAGIELIEKQDHAAFNTYCEETDNTICGRHPIGILLAVLGGTADETATELITYDQSDRVTEPSQNSVSYASLLTTQQLP